MDFSIWNSGIKKTYRKPVIFNLEPSFLYKYHNYNIYIYVHAMFEHSSCKASELSCTNFPNAEKIETYVHICRNCRNCKINFGIEIIDGIYDEKWGISMAMFMECILKTHLSQHWAFPGSSCQKTSSCGLAKGSRIMASQPTPLASERLVCLKKALSNPFFWGGYERGGRLTSHDKNQCVVPFGEIYGGWWINKWIEGETNSMRF